MLAGAALGTLPDLDSFPIALFTDDPVALMTLHRGFSHSLFVLPLLAWGIWAIFRKRGGRVAQAPRGWFRAIQLALVTHPLLDAFTVYGTQLLWPLPLQPVMWSSVFIIDPGYTLWLLGGVVVAMFAGARPLARRALVAGLALSTAYLGWSLLAKGMVEREAQQSLATLGLADAPRFSVPMPFNTLLWRVVAMTPDGFVEGEHSLVADTRPIAFRHYRSDVEALAAAADLPAVARLRWFNRGFMKAQVRDGRLVLEDHGRDLTLDAAVQAREIGRGEEGSSFELDGKETLRGNPLTLTIRGGPFVNIRRDRPYDFTARLAGAGTVLNADGQITRPFDFGRLRARLTLSGGDLADLYLITGITTPNTPPYEVSGDLTRNGDEWRFADFAGTVGDSDLSGDVLVDRDGHVRLLDFGIARLGDGGDERTATALRALTPEYAAPEQFSGAPATTAMDVYGIGALLYRLLAGVGPRPDGAVAAIAVLYLFRRLAEEDAATTTPPPH